MQDNHFAVAVKKRLGAKIHDTFLQHWENLGLHSESLHDMDALCRYLVTRHEWAKDLVASGENSDYYRFKDLTPEELTLQELAWRSHCLASISLVDAWRDGDFTLLYQGLMASVRYYYAGNIWLDAKRNVGYYPGAGVDHGGLSGHVLTCFACRRPDLAKKFFPRELGLVRIAHQTTVRISNLILGLLYDDTIWKEEALAKARVFLNGKRQLAERAVVTYLVALYENDADTMSEQLALLLKNFRKATWLMLGGGSIANAVFLYGLYLMGKVYLDDAVFRNVTPPSGSGWWDEYIALCLAETLPEDGNSPYAVFPEPLSFLNEGYGYIDRVVPKEQIVTAMSLDERAARSHAD